MDIVKPAVSAAAEQKPPPKYLHGMWVFGLEQNGEYEDAEAKAREGLEFEKVLGPDAWLDHGLAHALYFQGDDRLDDAVEFLESKSASWKAGELHPFLYTHNWWHLSLLRTEKRDFTGALQIFDERLWTEEHAEMKADPQVQLNALNLLWRLETRGQREATLPRWKQVLDGCRGTTLPAEADKKGPLQHSDLLLDVLLLRGMCAAGDASAVQLKQFQDAVQAHAEQMAQGSGEGAKDRAETYRLIADGVIKLFSSMDPAAESEARKQLKSLEEKWGAIGGSEEQRGILMEAVEGPVVCGEPERNYDTLFR